MSTTKPFRAKSLLNLTSNLRLFLITKRLMAKKISRGQDPEVIASMPVFQFTSDKISAKRKKRIYCWGYSGGGALGRLGLFRRIKYVGRPAPPPIEIKRAPMRMDFVDHQTIVTDVAAGFGFTVSENVFFILKFFLWFK